MIGESDMLWEDILKNAKVTGSSKGATLSFNRLKIKRPEKCKEKLFQYCINAVRLEKPNVYEIDTITVGEMEKYFHKYWEELPEETACKVIKKIDEIFLIYPTVIKSLIEPHWERADIPYENTWNIDEFVLKRTINKHIGKIKKVDIAYSLRSKKGTLIWYIDCMLDQKASSLSARELDWRK